MYHLSKLRFDIFVAHRAQSKFHLALDLTVDILITMCHGRKRSKMVMTMPQMMMMPQMMPQQEESSDEDERPRPGQAPVSGGSVTVESQLPSPRRPGAYIKDEHAQITRSATFVCRLPRVRLSESLEALHETLDATMTSELDLDGLLTCLWIFTRVKPNQRVCDLRHLKKILNFVFC